MSVFVLFCQVLFAIDSCISPLGPTPFLLLYFVISYQTYVHSLYKLMCIKAKILKKSIKKAIMMIFCESLLLQLLHVKQEASTWSLVHGILLSSCICSLGTSLLCTSGQYPGYCVGW